jgi:hypothetical protein
MSFREARLEPFVKRFNAFPLLKGAGWDLCGEKAELRHGRTSAQTSEMRFNYSFVFSNVANSFNLEAVTL